MATTTILSNATATIAGGTLGSPADVSDQLQSIVVTQAYDELEITSLADSVHKYAAGLGMNEITMTLFNSYGSGEIEEILSKVIGKNDISIVCSGTTSSSESASNPEYTLANAYLATTTPINSASVGELQVVEITFRGGTLTRDVTP